VRSALVQFQFPADEPREPSQEAQQMARDAIAFVVDIVSRSRTGKSAMMKLALINSLFDNTGESSSEIAKRFGVSVRAVEKYKAELLKDFLVRCKA
jgi:hypothetical protein